MRRIQAADFLPNAHGPGKNGFRGGATHPDDPPTTVDSEWLNGLQEESMNVIEAVGQTPDVDDNVQMLRAIRTMNLAQALSAAREVYADPDSSVVDVAWGATAGHGHDGRFLVLARTTSTDSRALIGRGADQGETWLEIPLTDKVINGVVHGGPMRFGRRSWIFVGRAGSAPRIWTSDDDESVGDPPIDWLDLEEQEAAGDAPLNAVCWNGSVLCAVGDYISEGSNAQVQTTNDPSAPWIKRTIAASSTGDYRCCDARLDTGRILIGSTTDIQASNDNGATWARVLSGVNVTKLLHVGGDVWLALCASAGRMSLRRSTNNGVSWTAIDFAIGLELGSTIAPQAVQAYGLCKVGSAIVTVARPQGGRRRARFCLSIDEGRSWLLTPRIQMRIPLEPDQRFRLDPNTDSGRTRSLIPTDPNIRSDGPDR